jgi:hypothetical protein
VTIWTLQLEWPGLCRYVMRSKLWIFNGEMLVLAEMAGTLVVEVPTDAAANGRFF